MLKKRVWRTTVLFLIFVLLCCSAGISAPAMAVDPYIIKLESNTAAKFQIWCVTNELSGTPLSDEFLDMTLVTITSGGTEYYKGKLADMQTPAITAITIAADDRISLDISFSFSEDADNRFQGVSYRLLWEFEAEVDVNSDVEINMAGGNTLYSNLNINPGDTYGFTIVVENGNPSPLPTPPPDGPNPWNPDNPDDPDNPDNPDNPDDPADKPGETDEPDDSDKPDDLDNLDQPDNSDNGDDPDDLDDLGDPDDNLGDPDTPTGDTDGANGINTGDNSAPAKNSESLLLLIGSIVFLVFVICVFIRIISTERKRQAGKLK